MKFRLLQNAAWAATFSLAISGAGFARADNDHANTVRPDTHAPIGVMGDHLHGTGEWMLSLRSMSMRMEGHRVGENRLTAQEVFQRGFGVAAADMQMDMRMLGVMYAPTDRVTLMGMANYIESDMTLMSNPHAMGGGHGGHGGMAHSGTFGHSSSGWGDLQLSSLARIGDVDKSRWHLNLGLSVPTGSVSELQGEAFLPYGMQLGSGTWDAKVGATFMETEGSINWGAQALATIRLEETGESGFGRSDALEATAWVSWRAGEKFSVSGRLKYAAEGALKGHYNGPHMHRAPPHFQENYGGDVIEALLGVNYAFQGGALRGHRLALEYGVPVYQQLNGVGMNREEMLTLGWQKAW